MAKLRPNLRVVLFALIALVSVGATITALAPRQNLGLGVIDVDWVAGECSPSQPGVSLVIDFGTDSELDTIERCLLGFKGTGWDALGAAGLAAEGTTQYPTGFSCRIDGWPSRLEQDCRDTPSYRDGFWAYYFAEPADKSWRFSGTGSALRKPKCGGYEGWRFVHHGEPAGQLTPRSAAATFSCKG